MDLRGLLPSLTNLPVFGSSRKSVGRFEGSVGLKDAWVLGFGGFQGCKNLA